MTPVFSVILPTYNRAELLARAVESVRHQSRAAAEIIVVDDGSTDSTKETLATQAPDVRYIYQANAGPAAARNTGVQAARGDWICFLDSDDVYLPHRLEHHAQIIRGDPSVECIFGLHETTAKHRKVTDNELWQIVDAGLEHGQAVLEITPEMHETIGLHQVWHSDAVSIRRDLFLRLGGFPTDLPLGEDTILWFQVVGSAAKSKISNIPVAVFTEQDNGFFERGSEQALIGVINSLEFALRATPRSATALRRGIKRRLSRSRTNHSYLLLRERGRRVALRAILATLLEDISVHNMRAVLSILKG